MEESHGFEARNIKTFNGRQGGGYSANLYREGKLVATCLEDASGGPLQITWKDDAAHQAAALYAKSLPALNSGYFSEGKPIMFDMSVDLFVEELVNEALLRRQLRNLTRGGKIAFMTPEGKIYSTIGDVASVADEIQQKFPDAVILNMLEERDAIAQMKAKQGVK